MPLRRSGRLGATREDLMHRRRFLQILAAWLTALWVGLFHRKAEATVQISGNYSGTIPSGTTAQIVGDVNLTGDLIVEGTLTGVDTFTLTGNGFQILVQNGGRVDLTGVEKTAWVRWDDLVVGWQVGDRLAVAPTAVGVYVPSEATWSGSWGTMTRPTNSPDVTLVDGSVAKPEVVNLSQSIVLQNLRRAVHAHDGAGVQILRWLKALNCGTIDVLGDYPIHFHLNGETSRGSVVEGVVVEGGKNHAFVFHGSHGITAIDCVGYDIINHAYWWDPPLNNNQPSTNDSDDITYDHCLALKVTQTAPLGARLSGFTLGRGLRNRCVNSRAVGVQGGNEASGFQWPETGVGNWIFQDCLAHNNKTFGIFAWQNSNLPHVIEDFDAYRNGKSGIQHGAYLNFYTYRRITLTGNTVASLINHALPHTDPNLPDKRIIFEDILADGPLSIIKHNAPSPRPVIFRRCTFPSVIYNEVNVDRPSYMIHEDSGLVPADFTFILIQPQSTIEIFEDGVLEHRWASGVWS